MPLHLDIVTPERKIFSDTVDNVYLPGADGEMGILPLHSGLVTALQPGELRYLHQGKIETLAIGSGFAEITQTQVIVLTDSALGEAEIDESGAAVLQNLFVQVGQPVSFEGERTEYAEAGQRLRMEAVDDVVRQSEDVEVVLREEAVAGDGVKTVVAQVKDLERGQAREDAALESVESVVRQVESDEAHATGKGVRSQPVVADVVPRQVEDK